MPQECKLLSYILGECDNWDGDMEQLTFYDFVPSKTITDWPKIAHTITIDIIEGTVYAYSDQPNPIKKWGWRDFIAMI